MPCSGCGKRRRTTAPWRSNEQQVVETEVVEQKTVIVVQAADPEVIYVPSYSPTVVYGPPVYPYPPIYYPPYHAGGAFVAFSVGVMWGAAIWGGSCCHCGWGHNNVNINVNNNFNRNTNINAGGGGGNWQHNPQHRGGTPYADKATASKYGGSARGDSMSSRQASARQQGEPDLGGASAGTSNRAGSAGPRTGQGAPALGPPTDRRAPAQQSGAERRHREPLAERRAEHR